MYHPSHPEAILGSLQTLKPEALKDITIITIIIVILKFIIKRVKDGWGREKSLKISEEEARFSLNRLSTSRLKHTSPPPDLLAEPGLQLMFQRASKEDT